MEEMDVDAVVQRALDLHKAGCNCAQSVACACAPVVGADEEELYRLMEGFGAGMGGFSETCGAISGGVAILGYANSGGRKNPRTKGYTYKLSRQLAARFDEANGSTLCPELKGLSGGPVLRPCKGCIEDGVRLTLEILQGRDTGGMA